METKYGKNHSSWVEYIDFSRNGFSHNTWKNECVVHNMQCFSF